MDARAAWREAPTAAAHLEQVRQELASLRQELAVADRQMDEATRTMHRLARDPVWSKNSCSLTLVVFQQPPKPFVTLHWTLTRCAWADHREEQDIALALMIPLVMKMCHILRQRMAE